MPGPDLIQPGQPVDYAPNTLAERAIAWAIPSSTGASGPGADLTWLNQDQTPLTD